MFDYKETRELTGYVEGDTDSLVRAVHMVEQTIRKLLKGEKPFPDKRENVRVIVELLDFESAEEEVEVTYSISIETTIGA